MKGKNCFLALKLVIASLISNIHIQIDKTEELVHIPEKGSISSVSPRIFDQI